MKLRELLVDLFNVSSVAPRDASELSPRCRVFENHVGREAVVSDLTNRSVNSWLAASETEYPEATSRRFAGICW